MTSKSLQYAGGAFAAMHERLVGTTIDWARLSLVDIDERLLQPAITTWQERVRTEYRSTQMMQRLLGETLAAGDPFDVHAGIVELIEDELRHVALCAGVVKALGSTPLLPEPLEVSQPPAFQRMSAPARALSIAITMLLVNETLSVGYIRDLAARCTTPAIADVLAATLEDESEHDAFGAQYVRQSLARFPITTLPQWRQVAAQALAPQREAAQRVLSTLAPAERSLDAHPDLDLITLGMFSPARQALVFEQTLTHVLMPLLRGLDLWQESTSP